MQNTFLWCTSLSNLRWTWNGQKSFRCAQKGKQTTPSWDVFRKILNICLSSSWFIFRLGQKQMAEVPNEILNFLETSQALKMLLNNFTRNTLRSECFHIWWSGECVFHQRKETFWWCLWFKFEPDAISDVTSNSRWNRVGAEEFISIQTTCYYIITTSHHFWIETFLLYF